MKGERRGTVVGSEDKSAPNKELLSSVAIQGLWQSLITGKNAVGISILL